MAEVIMLPRVARGQEEGVTVFPPVRTTLSSYLRTALLVLDAGLIGEEQFHRGVVAHLAREQRRNA